MTREERLNLAATNLVRQGLNAERGDALLELGDVPDLCWPSNSAEVGFFPSFVVPFLVAALNGHLSRSAPRCDAWERMADPAHSLSASLPSSKALRAFVDESYLGRTNAVSQ